MLTNPKPAASSELLSCDHLIKVPLCLQENPYSCGVACVQSILAGYGLIYRQDALSELLKQKPVFGTDYRNIISYMEMLGFQVSFHIDMDIELVREYIDEGITPILVIQAWKEDAIDYPCDWRDSHYVIACGYDENRLLFMDPWTLGNYTFITEHDLINRWHFVDLSGSHYYNSGLILKHDTLPYIYDPDIIRPMD